MAIEAVSGFRVKGSSAVFDTKEDAQSFLIAAAVCKAIAKDSPKSFHVPDPEKLMDAVTDALIESGIWEETDEEEGEGDGA